MQNNYNKSHISKQINKCVMNLKKAYATCKTRPMLQWYVTMQYKTTKTTTTPYL